MPTDLPSPHPKDFGTVTVPRWALQFVMDNAEFHDRGPAATGWSSDEMQRAKEALEKAQANDLLSPNPLSSPPFDKWPQWVVELDMDLGDLWATQSWKFTELGDAKSEHIGDGIKMARDLLYEWMERIGCK